MNQRSNAMRNQAPRYLIILLVTSLLVWGACSNNQSNNTNQSNATETTESLTQSQDGGNDLGYYGKSNLKNRVDLDAYEKPARDLIVLFLNSTDERALDVIQQIVRFPNRTYLAFLNEVVQSDLRDYDNYELIYSLVIEQLGQVGDAQSGAYLTRILEQHPDSVIRSRAAQALGELRYQKGVTALRNACKDEDLMVRWRSAEALGKIQDKNAVGALLFLLEDTDANVREAAIEALGSIRWENAYENIKHLVHNDPEPLVRKQALETLYVLNPAESIAEIASALEQDPSPEVKMEAARVLGLMGTEPSRKILLDTYVASMNPDVRIACIKGLSQFQKETMVPLLKRLFVSETELEVKEIIKWALELYGETVPTETAPIEDTESHMQAESEETTSTVTADSEHTEGNLTNTEQTPTEESVGVPPAESSEESDPEEQTGATDNP
jgi:HEAT repeat protein